MRQVMLMVFEGMVMERCSDSHLRDISQEFTVLVI